MHIHSAEINVMVCCGLVQQAAGGEPGINTRPDVSFGMDILTCSKLLHPHNVCAEIEGRERSAIPI